MKQKLSVLLGVLLFAGAFTPQVTNAASLVIEIGDRPYYTQRPGYWSHGRHWIHGHYVRC